MDVEPSYVVKEGLRGHKFVLFGVLLVFHVLFRCPTSLTFIDRYKIIYS